MLRDNWVSRKAHTLKHFLGIMSPNARHTANPNRQLECRICQFPISTSNCALLFLFVLNLNQVHLCPETINLHVKGSHRYSFSDYIAEIAKFDSTHEYISHIPIKIHRNMLILQFLLKYVFGIDRIYLV